MTPAALEWLARFRRYLKSERRLSPLTDASYARDLRALVSFCDRFHIGDLDEDLIDYTSNLRRISEGIEQCGSCRINSVGGRDSRIRVLYRVGRTISCSG